MIQISPSEVISISRAFVVSTIEDWRNDIAGLIADTRLPFRRQLAAVVMPARHRKMVAEFSDAIGQSKDAFEALVSTLTTASPHCATWLSDEHYATIYPEVTGMGVDTARLIASDALLSMLGAVRTPELIVTHFDRYVFDVATFSALMLTFLQFPMMLSHNGYIDEDTYQLKNPDDDAVIIRLMYTDHLTRALCQAAPGRWDYDVLLQEIRCLWVTGDETVQ